jgi:hypothetical protein
MVGSARNRSEPWVLEPELARAKRRAELEQKIERAAADLAKTMPTKQSNSDAVALVGYLAAIGVKTDTDTLNKWLVILAVLLIECGGGLSLAVGLSLAQTSRETMPTVDVSNTELDQDTPPEPQTAPEPAKPRIVAGGSVVQLAAIGPHKQPVQNRGKNQRKNRPKNHNRDQVANAIVDQLLNYKTLASSERQLARAIGAKRSTVRRAVLGLAATGAVRLSSSRAGTTVALAAAETEVDRRKAPFMRLV